MIVVTKLEFYESKSDFIHRKPPVHTEILNNLPLASKATEDKVIELSNRYKLLHNNPYAYAHQVIEDI